MRANARARRRKFNSSIMKKVFFLAGWSLLWSMASAQVAGRTGVQAYPSNWWVGMKHSTIQVIVRGEGVAKTKGVSITYPGVKLVEWRQASNPHYLILHLKIGAEAKPGTVKIELPGAGAVDFPLAERRKGNGTEYAQGIRSNDFIYFLMPDRWSNGDPGNDRIPGLRDQSLNRDSMYLRHGGDFAGIIDHLDYLQQLGVTALWMTPVILNDMPSRTEHGYAFTDHYTVDPRLGGAAMYQKLSAALHQRGMKLIQDAVYNHVGNYHWIVTDPPDKDWVHQWPEFTQTNYRGEPVMDPHASEADRKLSSDGWFTRQMPDLNQDNPDLAGFLIQHAIWCVETFGVDGWRIDTYIYNDLAFMNRCNQALLDEYPHLSLFGETWVHGTANQAFFARNTLNVPFKSNLPGVTDFQTNLYGIGSALNEPFGWTAGVNKLYHTLSNDFLYEDATKNVIFLDNHDMTRFFSTVNEDVSKLKTGIAWLLTCRGIPQLYYGTEVLMKGVSNPDGWVRLDFPGGWKGDRANKFIAAGRTAAENEVFDWTRKLATFRRSSSALKAGKMMQYVPEDGVYVYFRYDEHQTVMCVMNTNDKAMTINPARFSERIGNFKQGTEVVSGKTIDLLKAVEVPAKYLLVLELK